MKLKLLVVGFLVFVGQLAFAQGGPNHYLVPDHNYEQEVLTLVLKAQNSIDIIQNQFFAETGASRKVLDALIAKKERNPKINIRVFLEFSGNVRNFETKEKLEAAGITVLTSFLGNVHTRGVCVDEKFLLLGSTSISKTSMTKSNEMNAVVESEALGKAFTGYFDEVSKNPANPVNLSVVDENITLLTDATYFNEALNAIKTATDSLDISMHLIRISQGKDEKIKELVQALVDAQKLHNVKIRVLLEQSGKAGQKTSEANRDTQTFLKNSGVNAVYLDSLTTVSNSRFIIKDQKEILLGSSQWYVHDVSENHHANFKIDNPVLAKQLAIYYSQKVAYEGQRAPVAAPRRFWIGFRRPDITPEAFAKGINEQLIPGTKVGAERGLVGYTPTLTEGLSNAADFPQEIAMVTYQDDETYRAIRETPEGAAYGNLHWDFFAKELPSGLKSGSAVAVPYAKQVAFGSAYYLTQAQPSFQTGDWSYAVFARGKDQADTEFLKRVKEYEENLFQQFGPQGLLDVTFRVEKNFVFEFHRWYFSGSYDQAVPSIKNHIVQSGFTPIAFSLLKKGEFGNTLIRSGQGVNVQFKTQIEDPEIVYSPLREKFLSPITKEPEPPRQLSKEEKISLIIAGCLKRFQNAYQNSLKGRQR